MLDPKIGLLENLPVFKGLSSKQIGSIVNVGSKAFFQAGETLIVKDTAGDRAFLILTGVAECLGFQLPPGQQGTIGPGVLLGELAMLVETVHPFTVQARERVRAFAIHREALRRAMQNDPGIAQQIAENLLTRLRDFAQDLHKFDRLLAKVEGTDYSRTPTPLLSEGEPLLRRRAAASY